MRFKAITYEIVGDTIRVKQGLYDRATKTLEVKKLLYYRISDKIRIKTISFQEKIKYKEPLLWRTTFRSAELKDNLVVEENNNG